MHRKIAELIINIWPKNYTEKLYADMSTISSREYGVGVEDLKKLVQAENSLNIDVVGLITAGFKRLSEQ